MQWTPEVPNADWLRASLDEPWRGTMHDAVPRYFPAYARIFHPATRDRPVGRPWPGLPYAAHRREWDAFQDATPEIDVERVGWAETSAAFGTTFHPLAQWQRIVAPGVTVEHEDGPRDASGWRYSAPAVGEVDADVLAALAGVLAAHTTTPDDGVVALWEGWGDLVGHLGVTPSRSFLSLTTADDGSDRHDELLARSIRDPLNDAFRKPRWQPGILSDEISRGGRLSTLGRDYVVFRGGIAEFAAEGWVERMPWRDRDAEAAGFGPTAHSPNLVWPADRAWALVSEIDWDSTIVAGSTALVSALCAHPALEAVPIEQNASLQWDADRINA
ncbi:hypothetical protein LQ938_15285 [Microbacterium sp. cx-55]|uniref:hypothetical protein n=1 Tax=Microbacterium sp. cx-55 TaxID=2875948 RepID=UPI001CBD3C04|nr:hypothetical protein [Microbacterium sp. cx-55]MBZ4487164.1 hypothetical protein [Microbacterium sp. cx-55]UGB35192.1 hypothetical protein LQ938_15285 [Microbacterium sp. cx-55]